MPLDLSLSDMPWFGQPANPTAAIESGVRVGATLSSLAKQKREREMEEVRFAQEQHEFKQKDEAFDQNKRSVALQMQGQEYQNAVFKNKATQSAIMTASLVDNEEASTKIMALAYSMWSNKQYNNPEKQEELADAVTRAPGALNNPSVTKALEVLQAGRTVNDNNEARLELAQAKAEALAAKTTPSPLGKLLEESNAALLRGDLATVEIYKKQIDKEITPTGMRIVTNKDGTMTLETNAKSSAAAVPGALTPTNTTKMQQDLQSGQRLLAATDRLLPLISSETFGPAAFVNSVLKDDLLGNVFPSLVSEKRQDAAVIAGDIRSATIQSMKSDSNIAQTEVSKLEEMFPEPAKFLGSPKKAELLTKSVAKLAASRILLSGKKLGLYSESKDQFERTVLPQKIDRAVVKALVYDDIKALYDSGLIDSEILVALKNASDPELGYGITKEQAAAIYYGKR